MLFRTGSYLLLAAVLAFATMGLGVSGLPTLTPGIGQSVAVAAPLARDNDNKDNKDNDDNDNGGDNEDNDNGGDNEDNDNGGDNEDNDNGDNDGGGGGDVLTVTVPGPTTSACGGAGRDATFNSADGRMSVRVFASLSRSIRVQVTMVDPSAVASTPGTLVDRLMYDVTAQDCGSGATIADLAPGEVNLGARYTESGAWSNEGAFTIALLDRTTGQWTPTPKQAADPANNYDSATISRMGTYSIYQRP